MSRYSKRTATCETVTLNSARKGGNTLVFWFYRKVGRSWVEFDVRDVAGEAGVVDLPDRMTSDELRACREGQICFESLLQRDLQRAADWCFKVDPDGALAQKVAI